MKRKNFFAAFMAFAILCSTGQTVNYYSVDSLTAVAAEEQEYTEVVENGIKYNVYSDHAEVGRQDADTIKCDTVISDYVSGVPVTVIGMQAFYKCEKLSVIYIPESVTSIGFGAFCYCVHLSKITIPKNVTSIGENAFAGCKELSDVTIPESVMTIGKGAFWQCTGLSSITIVNKSCVIEGDEWTICNEAVLAKEPNVDNYFTGTIYGYENSTAQEYADKYGCKFTALKDVPKITTTTTTTTMITMTTTQITTSFTLPISENASSVGEINGDGVINAVDASYILQLYVIMAVNKTSASTLDTVTRYFYDVNTDGAINAIDASYVLSYYAYMSTNKDKNDNRGDFANYVMNN